jgi:hypothetical protein
MLPYFSCTAQRLGVKIWTFPVSFSIAEREHSVSGSQRSFTPEKQHNKHFSADSEAFSFGLSE